MSDIGKNLKTSIVDQSKTVGNFLKTAADAAGTKWQESSTVTKACVVGSVAGVTAPLTIIPVAGLFGFTSAGVVAGSIAASMQTATTISGSIFALCQSAGAVGAVAISTSIGVGLAAGATASGVAAVVYKKQCHDKKTDDEAVQVDGSSDDFARRVGSKL